MDAKGIVARDRAKKSRLLPHDLLLRSRVTARIVRSTISDPKRSLCDGDHVRAFLLYRLYRVADVRFRIGTTVASMCSILPFDFSKQVQHGSADIIGADVCPLWVRSGIRHGQRLMSALGASRRFAVPQQCGRSRREAGSSERFLQNGIYGYARGA
jgi:hypothetical protein